MTDYAEFQEYYLRAIWREGDTALIQDLPNLIREAEARISRDMKNSGIIIVAIGTHSLPGIARFSLPGDFGEVLTVIINGEVADKSISFTEAQRIQTEIDQGNCLDLSLTLYAVAGQTVYIPSNAGSEDVDTTIYYYAKASPYEDLSPGSESFYDKYPDFYISALNVQVYNYLRDFNLSGEYNGKYTNILESMQRDSNYRMFPSGQLGQAMMPENVK